MYDDLFNGNPNTYKENTIKSLEQFESTLDSFKCDYYDGRKGTIIKVEITATSKDNITSTTVQCFRSDIPQYLVTGNIDKTFDLSSGEIALWVMYSLEVTEHFNIEDK